MTETNPTRTIVVVARAIAYAAYAYVVVVQVILVQGFLLLLLGANRGSSYVDWAYRSLDRVMAPFRGIFESVDLSGNAVLDTSVLFAMVMYGILGLVVHSLLDWLTYRLNRIEAQRLRDEARAEAEAAAFHAATMQAAAYGAPGSGFSGYPTFGQTSPAAHAAPPLPDPPPTMQQPGTTARSDAADSPTPENWPH